MTDKVLHTFVCERDTCKCKATIELTQEEYDLRFKISPAMDCPLCNRTMYKVYEKEPLYTAGMVKNRVEHERQRVLEVLVQDFKGRYVEDAIAEIRRFNPEVKSARR